MCRVQATLTVDRCLEASRVVTTPLVAYSKPKTRSCDKKRQSLPSIVAVECCERHVSMFRVDRVRARVTGMVRLIVDKL